MKKYMIIGITAAGFFAAGLIVPAAFARQPKQSGYILEHEKDLAVKEPGPHEGGGMSTVYHFFSKALDCRLVFRKRVLHPGSSIGYHLQETDEIYYIVSGSGEMKMNGELFTVSAGDAILTRAGSSHGLKQSGVSDLVVMIDYNKK